ncbi:MAG: hypothetical protein U0R17_00750 [Acidimicrobiia bacterium]
MPRRNVVSIKSIFAYLITIMFFAIFGSLFILIAIDVLTGFARSLLVDKSFKSADLLFILAMVTLLVSTIHLRNLFYARKRFIFVSEDRLPVDPCDRRDEFLDIPPSWTA